MEEYNNLEDKSKFDITKLGRGIKFFGYGEDENNPDLSKAFTTNSFEFDGIDDYIRVVYDDENQKEILAKNGFTFEFYGILNGGTSYDINGSITNSTTYRGLFCYWNGDNNTMPKLRFGMYSQPMRISWNASSESLSVSDFSSENYPWNIYYNIGDSLLKKEIYLTITLDITDSYQKEGETFYKQTLYVNGEKTEYQGGYNKKQWDTFLGMLESLKYFCLGRSAMTNAGSWHYTKMSCYSLKLYNKGLSEEEVQESYKKTVAYHKFLVNSDNGITSGKIGGKS